jgi:UDP-glucose 4-epimerase
MIDKQRTIMFDSGRLDPNDRAADATMDGRQRPDDLSASPLCAVTREAPRPRRRTVPPAPIRSERILITGGAGFIGGHTVAALLDHCDRVAVIDDFSSGSPENLRDAIDRGLDEQEVVVADVREPAAARAVERWKPTILVHLAAQSRVAASMADPVADAEVNIAGTVNILTAGARVGVRRIVLASSGGTVYGQAGADGRSLTENVWRPPTSPYGLAKSVAEDYLWLFTRLYPLRGTSLAIGNAYGPAVRGGPGAGVVAAFVTQMLARQPAEICGDGKQTRDFVFVRDVAEAVVAACVVGPTGRINIGSGRPTSLNRLVELVAAATGQPVQSKYLAQRAGEVRHVCLDVSRAAQLLGWYPRTALDEGIQHVVDAARRAQTPTA